MKKVSAATTMACCAGPSAPVPRSAAVPLPGGRIPTSCSVRFCKARGEQTTVSHRERQPASVAATLAWAATLPHSSTGVHIAPLLAWMYWGQVV